SVRRARDAYLAENGFTVAAYDARWTPVSFFGVRFAVPNTRRHRWGIMLHDLHHVATGFGTDLTGEGEISAWEISGAPRLGPYVGSIVAGGALMGLALAPRRALAAVSASRGGSSPFGLAEAPGGYESLLALTLGALRARLGL